jgi:hypothetical protein
MSGLSKDAQDILNSARHLDDPTDVERARVKKALFVSVAAGITATTASTGAAVAAAAAPAAATTVAAVTIPVAKLVLSAVLVLSGVGGGVWWQAHRANAPARAVHQTSPHVAGTVALVAPTIQPAPLETPEAPEAPALARHRHAAAPHVAASRLQEEIALLGGVNAALRSDDAHTALDLLADYEARFPHGMLREEVQATRIIARCQLTPGRATTTAATMFLAAHPSSPLASRVRGSCHQER